MRLVDERVRDVLIVAGGAIAMIGVAVAAMAVVTSPDSWVMQTASKAVLDHQAVLTSYALNSGGH